MGSTTDREKNLKPFYVMVTREERGYVRVMAEDAFEARCLVLDMDGDKIYEAVPMWISDDDIEITDNVERGRE